MFHAGMVVTSSPYRSSFKPNLVALLRLELTGVNDRLGVAADPRPEVKYEGVRGVNNEFLVVDGRWPSFWIEAEDTVVSVTIWSRRDFDSA